MLYWIVIALIAAALFYAADKRGLTTLLAVACGIFVIFAAVFNLPF